MAPKPIIRPGPSAGGPPGWSQKQQEKLSEAVEAENSADSGVGSSEVADGMGKSNDSAISPPRKKGFTSKMKDSIHKVGEKLALVPKTGADRIGSHTQNASTMPEEAG